MSSAFDLRLSNILAVSITNNLKPFGFQRHGNIFAKPLEELSWIVSVQKSQWNTQNNSEFTLNCGVYVPGVVSIYSPALMDRPEPLVPKLTDCCIYSRIGMLTEKQLDIWWRLRAGEESQIDRQIAEDISNHVKQEVLPFLQRFTSRDSVMHFLQAPRPKQEKQVWPFNPVIKLAYLSILYFLSKRQEDCCTTIVEAELKADPGAMRQNITRLHQYLCS